MNCKGHRRLIIKETSVEVGMGHDERVVLDEEISEVNEFTRQGGPC